MTDKEINNDNYKLRYKTNPKHWTWMKTVDVLLWQRTKACAQAMDRGVSDWSQEFWCKTMGKVIENGTNKILKADAEAIADEELLAARYDDNFGHNL